MVGVGLHSGVGVGRNAGTLSAAVRSRPIAPAWAFARPCRPTRVPSGGQSRRRRTRALVGPSGELDGLRLHACLRFQSRRQGRFALPTPAPRAALVSPAPSPFLSLPPCAVPLLGGPACCCCALHSSGVRRLLIARGETRGSRSIVLRCCAGGSVVTGSANRCVPLLPAAFGLRHCRPRSHAPRGLASGSAPGGASYPQSRTRPPHTLSCYFCSLSLSLPTAPQSLNG